MNFIPRRSSPPDEINSPASGGPGSAKRVLSKVVFYLVLPYIAVFALFQIFPINFLPVGLESQMGMWMAPTANSENKATAKMVELLKKIGPEHPRVPITVAVTSDLTFNAATYPGGVIRFHKGAFKALKGNEELSMILAHEIAHSELGHVGRRLTQSLMMLIPDMILRSVGVDILDISQDLVRKAFSRKDEMDADDYAAKVMLEHYGSLDGGVRAFEAMEKAVLLFEIGGHASNYFSTHPLTKKRIERLKKLREHAIGG